jgi:hypothetical protein
MKHLSMNACDPVKITGILKHVICKKNGRITRFHIQREEGVIELKASKYLRVVRGYTPRINDVVELKLLKKVKSGQVKLKAFAIAPSRNGSPPAHIKTPQNACTPIKIALCQSSKCQKLGAQKVWDTIEKELSRTGRAGQVQLMPSKCLGQCKKGPAAKLPSGRVCSRLGASTVLGLIP